MITQEQMRQFRLIVASQNKGCNEVDDEFDFLSETSNIATTHDTIEDFFAANGRRLKKDRKTGRYVRPETPLELEQTPYGDVYVWQDVQTRKGARRGTAWVVDFGDFRACYFDGEV